MMIYYYDKNIHSTSVHGAGTMNTHTYSNSSQYISMGSMSTINTKQLRHVFQWLLSEDLVQWT